MTALTHLIRVILNIVWALWFGGMIALLIFVIQLFKGSHETGAIAAPVLFRTFAVYQIGLGIIATICACSLMIVSKPGRATAPCALCLLSSLSFVFIIHRWTIEMDMLRALHASQDERFKTLHHWLSIAYTTEACLLLLGGVAFMLSEARRDDSA